MSLTMCSYISFDLPVFYIVVWFPLLRFEGHYSEHDVGDVDYEVFKRYIEGNSPITQQVEGRITTIYHPGRFLRNLRIFIPNLGILFYCIFQANTLTVMR